MPSKTTSNPPGRTRAKSRVVVDRRAAELADQRRVLAACSTPQLESGHPAEREQRLTDGGSMHEHALASLHPGWAVKELVCGRPAQDQRCRLRGVDARRHARHVVGPERAIGGIRREDRHIGHAVAKLKAPHAIAELIDFTDDVIAQHERWLAVYRLRVEVAPDHDIGVHHARGEHADPYLAAAGRR
jgi:hypothetical protein